MQKLPDFDEMHALAIQAADAKGEMVMLEWLKDATSAKFMRAAVEDESYWLGNKAPTATVHLAKIIAKIGNTATDEETISAIQERLAEVNRVYTEATEKLKIMHAMIAIYQTESANKRVALT